jgi:hypothetical protein
MRRLIRLFAALTALLLLLGNSNCSKNKDSDAPQFVTTLQVENSSSVVSGGFAQGDTINLVLTVRNRSSSAQTLYFNTSEFANFAVVDAGTVSVEWNCDTTAIASTCTPSSNITTPPTTSGGAGFVQIDLPAFQSKSVTFSWTQIGNSGVQLVAGNYEVLGGFTVYNTTGPGNSVDNGSSMAQGAPTAAQLFPSVYRSILIPFTIQ